MMKLKLIIQLLSNLVFFFFFVADHSFYRVFGVAHIAAKSSECNLVFIFLFIFWYRFMRTFCPLCTDSGFPFFCAIFFFSVKANSVMSLSRCCIVHLSAIWACNPSEVSKLNLKKVTAQTHLV